MSYLKHSVLIIIFLFGTINVFSQSDVAAIEKSNKKSLALAIASSLASDSITSDSIVVPNVFTPNLDGFNDYFEVKTNGINHYEFSVYSRSGMLVYKAESMMINWDGRSLAGDILQPGVYYYIIRQTDGASSNAKKGFVQILY
ncbi:MAG: gliding motility-associated C-terminal domain-containing protein [Bacteroidales bacterium]|nr:gliding motility-associated C-terminal domain-containing protein [Bacteroidales bacterium]MCF8405969.1 gliding motility-associated C-terminal domain-containing protein [Bacteroidales bacterium]